MRRDAEPVEVGDLSRASSSSGTRGRVGGPDAELVEISARDHRHRLGPRGLKGWHPPQTPAGSDRANSGPLMILLMPPQEVEQ